jgi:hypothetical protein
MHKLTLNVDALAVESFRPESKPAPRGEGTVDAHAVADTQQFRCTYFCTYNCTGLPC